MKEARVGNLVLHNYKHTPPGASRSEHYFCGYSFVARRAQQITDEPPHAGSWSGRGKYYRNDLERFQRLLSPLSVKEFLKYYGESVRDQLPASKWFPFLYQRRQSRNKRRNVSSEGDPSALCTPWRCPRIGGHQRRGLRYHGERTSAIRRSGMAISASYATFGPRKTMDRHMLRLRLNAITLLPLQSATAKLCRTAPCRTS